MGISKFILTVAVTIFLSIAHAMAAEEGPLCDASNRCSTASSNLEYKNCLAQLAKEQDDELNALYKKVRTILRDDYDKVPTSAPKIWPQILEAQRDWITFRDAQCSGEAAIAQGGTAAGGWFSDCVCRLTAQRNANLKFILKNFGPQ
ncbi:MAG: lysozyme inhibitor LprI family protein [Hyphomicrobiales bacterium]